MFEQIPAEVSFGWAYFPPVFFVILLGVLGAFIITDVLNRTGFSKYFWHPPLAFIAISAIICAIIGFLFIPL